MAEDKTPKLAKVLPIEEEEENVDLDKVVKQLCQANRNLAWLDNRVPCSEPLPSREVVQQVVESLRAVLFPGYFGNSEVRHETLQYHLGTTIDEIRRTLQVQVMRGIAFSSLICECDQECEECEERSRSIVTQFITRLPHIQQMVAKDVQAAYEGDPAATTPDETVFCYPGVQAITNYRMAHELHHLEVPLLPRMITELAHSATGIDIHPGAHIGEGLFIDHGSGVVVGETCIIGDQVRIYQGVTLGAKSFPLDEEGNPVKGIDRHPVIEDEVVIYSGATILGRVTIGRGSTIGGNVWLTRSVPPGSKITTQPARMEAFDAGGGI